MVGTSFMNATHDELFAAVRAALIDGGVPEVDVLDASGAKPDKVTPCTALISMPALKGHWLTGIGTVLKNYIMASGKPADYHKEDSAKLGEIWGMEPVAGKTKLVLVCRDAQEEQRAKDRSIGAMVVQAFNLTRMGQIKMATVLAFSKQILKSGDVFVFLTGVIGHSVDTVVTMRVGEEYERLSEFHFQTQPPLWECPQNDFDPVKRWLFLDVFQLT